MRKLLDIDMDVWGASASFLCAIHCALVPLIVTFGMLSGIGFLASHLWDIAFISVSLILAFTSLRNGYVNHHRNLRPSLTAMAGFGSFLLGHLLLDGLIGAILSVSGGLIIAYAHILNYQACRTCTRCRD